MGAPATKAKPQSQKPKWLQKSQEILPSSDGSSDADEPKSNSTVTNDDVKAKKARKSPEKTLSSDEDVPKKKPVTSQNNDDGKIDKPTPSSPTRAAFSSDDDLESSFTKEKEEIKFDDLFSDK